MADGRETVILAVDRTVGWHLGHMCDKQVYFKILKVTAGELKTSCEFLRRERAERDTVFFLLVLSAVRKQEARATTAAVGFSQSRHSSVSGAGPLQGQALPVTHQLVPCCSHLVLARSFAERGRMSLDRK